MSLMGKNSAEAPEVSRRPRKFPQTVWVRSDVFAKVLAWSEESGVAPNVVIARILESFVEKGFAPVEVREVVKTVTERVPFIMCPGCLGEFRGVDTFREHLPCEALNRIVGVGRGGGVRGAR